MKIMKRKQEGMSFWGLVCVMASIAMIVLFALRAFPLYNEQIGVKSALKALVDLPAEHTRNKKATFKSFLKNAQINGVRRFNSANIKEFATVKKSKKGGKRFFILKYQAKNKLFGNLFLMLKVDETVELKSVK